jgi:hypothetical protein
MDNQSLFSKYFNKVLRETMTAASVGMGATSDTQFGGRSDSAYAPGDARIPSILGAKKKKKKNYKYDSRSRKYYKPKAVSEGKGKGKAKAVKARVSKQGFMGSASREHGVKKGKGSFKRRGKHQKNLTDSKVPMIRRNKTERIAI